MNKISRDDNTKNLEKLNQFFVKVTYRAIFFKFQSIREWKYSKISSDILLAPSLFEKEKRKVRFIIQKFVIFNSFEVPNLFKLAIHFKFHPNYSQYLSSDGFEFFESFSTNFVIELSN